MVRRANRGCPETQGDILQWAERGLVRESRVPASSRTPTILIFIEACNYQDTKQDKFRHPHWP